MRRTNLRQLVVNVDPNWVVDSRVVDEYRFTRKVFRADYGHRGAYHDPAPGQQPDDVEEANR